MHLLILIHIDERKIAGAKDADQQHADATSKLSNTVVLNNLHWLFNRYAFKTLNSSMSATVTMHM